MPVRAPLAPSMAVAQLGMEVRSPTFIPAG